MRLAMHVAGLGLATGTMAAAQPAELSIYSPGMRMLPSKLPSDEALALGRRLAVALDGGAIARRTQQLVQLAQANDPPRPVQPTYPNGPIRAVPPVDLANYPDWGFLVQQRVIDHAGLVYARKYGVGELKPMVDFFESPAGRKHLQERPTAPTEDLVRELASPLLEIDLWNVVCGAPVRQKEEDAPHHEFERLHPPVKDYPLPPRPAWCAYIEVRGQQRP